MHVSVDVSGAPVSAPPCRLCGHPLTTTFVDLGMSPPCEDFLTADLRKVGNVMLVEWLRKSGDDGKKVIDGYRAMP